MRPFWLTVIAVLALTACDERAADKADSAAGASETAQASAVADAATGAPTPVPGASESPVAEEPDDSACGADKLGDYVNTLPTSDILAKVRAAVGHDRIRLIEPGDEVDADLRPDRLNLETGVDGRIKRFRCG